MGRDSGKIRSLSQAVAADHVALRAQSEHPRMWKDGSSWSRGRCAFERTRSHVIYRPAREDHGLPALAGSRQSDMRGARSWVTSERFVAAPRTACVLCTAAAFLRLPTTPRSGSRLINCKQSLARCVSGSIGHEPRADRLRRTLVTLPCTARHPRSMSRSRPSHNK